MAVKSTLVGVLAGLTLLAAACGGDDDASTATDVAATGTDAAGTTAASTPDREVPERIVSLSAVHTETSSPSAPATR